MGQFKIYTGVMTKQLSKVLAYPGFSDVLTYSHVVGARKWSYVWSNGRQWWMWEVDARVGVFDMFVTLW